MFTKRLTLILSSTRPIKFRSDTRILPTFAQFSSTSILAPYPKRAVNVPTIKGIYTAKMSSQGHVKNVAIVGVSIDLDLHNLDIFS